jgi:hypothetical protein
MKYKRVIKSILTFKLYKIVYSFNIKTLIKAIINKVFKIKLLLIIYINSKLFYKYFIKLRII